MNSLKVTEINTGKFALDGGAMFGNVPRTLWEKKIAPDLLHRIPLSMRALLVQLPTRNILVDVGMGDSWDAQTKEMFDVKNALLDEVLFSQAGIRLTQITDVILTHLHFDHAGALTREDPIGVRHSQFPNATIYLQEENWKQAQNPNSRERASYLSHTWAAAQNQFQLVNTPLMTPTEILPGISVIQSNGHTFGQQLVRVETSTQGIFYYCGDIIPTQHHVSVPWIMGYDLQPLVMLQEKELLLEMILKDNAQIYFEHDAHLASTKIESFTNKRGEKSFRIL